MVAFIIFVVLAYACVVGCKQIVKEIGKGIKDMKNKDGA